MKCSVRDTPVFYEAYGVGVPIVLLHGFSCDHRLMKGCMEPVFARQTGWQRIYLDLPGMGQTPGTENILNLVLDFIDIIIPDQQFLLVGESYGGYLSRGIVQRKFRQVAGIALICPGIIMNRSQRDLPLRTVILEDSAFLTRLDPADAEELASIAVVQNQYNWERFRDEILSGVLVADETFLAKIEQQYSCSFDVDMLPQPFSGPALLLMGRQDHVAGYRDAWRILENYPRGTFAVLDRAGHNLQIEQPQLFTALMSEWLDRVRESM